VRVLVTGASGFIGARVARQLIVRGHEVTALSLPGDRLDRLQGVDAHLAACDLGDATALDRAISQARPEGCIHLAWYAVPGLYLHSEENLKSLEASIALLRRMLTARCRAIVMAGTCAEYDPEASERLREDGATKPATLYAAAKLAMCLVGAQLARAGEARFAWGRVFYPYGPGEDPRRALPALIRTLLAGGTFDATEGAQVRDYVHVDDVASGFVTLLESEADGVYNLCSGAPYTMRQIMSAVGAALDAESRIRFGAVPYRGWEPKRICGDNTKLRALGWAPRFDLDSGLRDAIAFWRRADSYE
jgi:nucleoside-diphosphate-sugar epimerase